MSRTPSTWLLLYCIVLGLVFGLAGCSNDEVTLTILPSATTSEISEPTLAEPSITPTPPASEEPQPTEPLAARVNGEGILLKEYEAELARFQQVSGTGLATYSEEVVLRDLVDQVLLAQAAQEAGFVLEESMLQARIQDLGLSDQALKDWMSVYGYSEDHFHRAMNRAITAAWMRDQIITEVPGSAEQVHARQILLYNSGQADAVYAQLEAGTDFGTLAAEYDPLTLGDLGWFPRGYLNVSELDDVLFTLEIGAYSPVIQSPLGYHILQVLERETDHLLTADARRALQVQALNRWLEEQRNQSEIIILMP